MNYEKAGNEIQIKSENFEFRIFTSDADLKAIVQDFIAQNLQVKVMSDLYPTSVEWGQSASEVVKVVKDAFRETQDKLLTKN